jgi:hypothetical protein
MNLRLLPLLLSLHAGVAAAATESAKAANEVESLAASLASPAPIKDIPLTAAAATKSKVAVLLIRSSSTLEASLTESFAQSLRSALSQGPLQLTTFEALNAGALPATASTDAATTKAQSLGVDLLLIAEIAAYNLRQHEIAGRRIHQLDLRAGLTLHSASRGAALHSSSQSLSRRGFDAQALGQQALSDLGSQLGQRSREWKIEAAAGKPVIAEVRVQMDGLQLPFLPGPDAAVVNQPLPLYAQGASVEVDGVLVGQAPCRVELWPGLHRLRASRDGIGSREVSVNITSDRTIELTLTPDAAARSAFQKQLLAMEQLRQMQREGRQREQILKAKAEAMRGFATFLRQSGLRLDYRKVEDKDKLSTLPSAAEPNAPQNAPSKP